MHVIRVLLVALFGLFAIVAGLVTAAAVSIAGALVHFARRGLRHTEGRRMTSGARPRFAREPRGEVIDVTATEVPADPAQRYP